MARAAGSLRAYIVQRLLLTVPMVFILLTLVFYFLRAAPGNGGSREFRLDAIERRNRGGDEEADDESDDESDEDEDDADDGEDASRNEPPVLTVLMRTE